MGSPHAARWYHVPSICTIDAMPCSCVADNIYIHHLLLTSLAWEPAHTTACYACGMSAYYTRMMTYCVCMHVGSMLCQHEGILSMYVSVVCSMRCMLNNLCCIILIIKICSVHLIWYRTNTCFGYHYTYCRTHMPISGLQESFST